MKKLEKIYEAKKKGVLIPLNEVDSLTAEDVKSVAKSIKVDLTDKQIVEVLKMYPAAQKEDPTGTWDLVIEQVIHDVTSLDEAFLGIMSKEEKAKKAKLEADFDKLKAEGAIGDKQALLDKAKQDNHNGSLSVKAGTGEKFAGKKIMIYTPVPTTMQKLAAGTSAVTGGGGSGERQARL